MAGYFNGAMYRNLNKGITEIQYNSLNLPRQMIINSPSVKAKNYYTYSASGVKLKTRQRYDPNYTVTPSNATSPINDGLSDYKDTDYVGNIIYEKVKSGSAITNKTRILIDGGYIENGVYHYYISDHLGNNRVVANSSGTVVQSNQYYPFGSSFADTPMAEQGKQPYKYNNKELDMMHGLNMYDYSARWKDDFSFTTVDPLAEKYPWISPYAYAGNNPIRNIDINGDSITVLNMGSGSDQHMAILIQNDAGKWQYFSVNGNNVYVSGKFSGGRKFNDLAIGEFDSPQQFLESAYNSKGDSDDKSIDYYEFTEGLVIPTTPEQDKTIRDKFTDIANNEEYSVNPANRNHCGTAVQKSLEKAGIDVKSTEVIPGRTIINRSTGGDTYTYPTKTLRGYSYLPSTIFKDIRQNNPQGLYIRKSK